MTGAEWVAVISGVTALVGAVTAGIVQIILTLKQNKVLATAAATRDECATKLEEVHVAVTGVPSKPKEATDAKPNP